MSTATHHLLKFLVPLLLPLRESEYTAKNSKSCIQKVKLDKSSSNYEIVLSDVKSLFSNASLDQSNDIILIRICNNSAINTDISRSKMKKLLYLRTKNVHFSFDNNIQNGVLAIGPPLGPTMDNIFMVQLERSVIPGNTVMQLEKIR